MKRIVVGMSGGVDSSVTALLLKQQGWDVVGLFMNNWEEQDDDGHCTATKDFEDVRQVCSKIDIPYFSVNFAKEYKERVFSYFLQEYEKGRTPNPDVMCNREIKFGPFLRYAKGLGADKIATGHFAGSYTENGLTYLKQAKDKNKDQTYFLNQLSQEQLKDVIFPLCDLTKAEVRQIAAENELLTADKKDSTGICFIGERNFRDFLSRYLPGQAGDILTADGKKVGRHVGLMHYTLGQRRGLDIGGIAGGSGRWFVVGKDLISNVLYVSQGEDDCLFSSALTASGVNWIPQLPKETEFECYARTRHRQPLQKAVVNIQAGGNALVRFKERQRAVTEGQYVVFYDEANCLGGGVIETSGDF